MFEAHIQINLEPQFYKEFPRIQWGIDGLQHDIELTDTFSININQKFDAGPHRVEILFYNKYDQDSQQPVDKAVKIKSVLVEELPYTKISQGTYFPEFPEPWGSEQRAQGVDLFETYRHSTYLGWNGLWVFEFSCPIYQWIHRTENLGFYYV
jgi:hypothetical protein